MTEPFFKKETNKLNNTNAYLLQDPKKKPRIREPWDNRAKQDTQQQRQKSNILEPKSTQKRANSRENLAALNRNHPKRK
jgi:hypothetical protein